MAESATLVVSLSATLETPPPNNSAAGSDGGDFTATVSPSTALASSPSVAATPSPTRPDSGDATAAVSPSPTPVATIAGGVASLVALGLVVLAIFVLLRRRRRKDKHRYAAPRVQQAAMAPGSGYQLVRLRHDRVKNNPHPNPIILASFPGSADNVLSWKTFGGCPGKNNRGTYPAVKQPESLCFVYDNGGVLRAQIAGEMCKQCYDALVPNGWTTYSAPYSAGRVDANGSWSPTITVVGRWVNKKLIRTNEEGIDTQEFTESINGFGDVDKSSGLTRYQIKFPSYEFAATWKTVVKERNPFYCDMVNLTPRFDPKAPAKQENLRIRRANDPYYQGTLRNLGFWAGENTQHEIKTVGNRHEEMSRDGIYYNDALNVDMKPLL